LPVQGQSSELSCVAAAAAATADDDDDDKDDNVGDVIKKMPQLEGKNGGRGQLVGRLKKFSGSVALMLLCASRIQFQLHELLTARLA